MINKHVINNIREKLNQWKWFIKYHENEFVAGGIFVIGVLIGVVVS